MPSDAGVRADCVIPCPATQRAAVLVIETDSISVIGPTTGNPARRPHGVTVLGLARPSCYDRPMRAFVCEVDHYGLRRLLPEDLLPTEKLGRLARIPSRRPATVAWALLDESAAEALREDLRAG